MPAADGGEFVGVLFDAAAQGQAWVRAKVEAGEPAFVQMWETYGLADRHAADATWLAENRGRMVAALQ
ncbi:MAG: hypothetical protein M3Q27_11900 [Actinomycetota bacterium]|nr:hypothetical protein [Actinomycetota bacterium]